jgi:hypothetical protein
MRGLFRGAAIAGIALASAAITRADGPVVHEYVPDVEEDEGTIVVTAGGADPAALVYRGEVIPAPAGGDFDPRRERAMQAVPGDERMQEEVGRRSPSFRPDRVTELHGQVGYFEVFSPSISPYKRVTALDGVALARDGTPVLGIAERTPARRRVAIEGAHAAPPDGRPRDRFWGNVLLDFAAGREVPLPSVSPESRILTLRTEPAVSLHVERDGADNWYAVLDEPLGAHTEVRVVFLTDAPRTYFGTELPSAPSDAQIHEVPQMPPAVERRALEFAASLGLQRGMRFDVVLSRLTEHFRSFVESRDPPRDTGDIYWDLATGMRGICRHRAYAFVVTAQALGIMARFVQNEAHAWVEVHLPENRGWMRVDLGGSSRGLVAHDPMGGPSYRPEVSDPLPRPEAYQRAYAEARRPSEGELDPRASRVADRGSPGAVAAAGAGGGAAGAGHGAAGTAAGGAWPPWVVVREGTARETRAPLDLRVDVPPVVPVQRGEMLSLSGSARSGRLGVAGLRIEVLLASERGGHERLLGVTVTNEHGLFWGSFGVPPDLAVGDYRLVVRSPGNAQVAPSIAR